jgi:hypothetical protein
MYIECVVRSGGYMSLRKFMYGEAQEPDSRDLLGQHCLLLYQQSVINKFLYDRFYIVMLFHFRSES